MELAQPIDGEVQLARTNRGILARAQLQTALKTECSRCLRDVIVPIRIDLREEFLPSIDLGDRQAGRRTTMSPTSCA